MKKRAVSRWRLISVLTVPVAVIAISVLSKGCGSDNTCGQLTSQPSQAACDSFGKLFDCSSINFESSTGNCDINGCTICSCTQVANLMTDATSCAGYGASNAYGCLATFNATNNQCILGGECMNSQVDGMPCITGGNATMGSVCTGACKNSPDPDNPVLCNSNHDCSASVGGPGGVCNVGTCSAPDPPNPSKDCTTCTFPANVFTKGM